MLAIALVLLAPLVTAQEPPDPEEVEDELFGFIEVFELDTADPQVVLPINGQGVIDLVFRDLSRDSAGGASGGAAESDTGLFHRGTVKITPLENKDGWLATSDVVGFTTRGGQERIIPIRFQADTLAEDPYFQVLVEVTVRSQSTHESSVSIVLQGYTPGLEAFTAQSPRTYLLEPREIINAPLRVSNAVSLFPRAFDVQVVDNPCGIHVATDKGTVIDGGRSADVPVTLEAPSDRFWYRYDSCLIMFEVFPSDAPARARTVTMVVQLNGFNVDPGWFIAPFWILLIVLLLLLIGKRRKERVEEEILGKPQKPWTIPAEQVYLAALKQKDERAWYVVRNYLMKEEYASALLWYKAYKKATRGQRSKERLIVRQENKFEKWQDKWAKKATRPQRKAERYEEKLQAKLDRKARKAHRKQLKKWDKKVEKIEAAHEKQATREHARWDREAKKAEKRGLAAPARPDVGEPDLPPEPEIQRTLLADHKWQAKADRRRLRMEKKEARIRDRFQRKRERHLRKVRRKVQRIGRKLDDPDFASEHPLLSGGSSA
jgi:hypothetical protein